VEKKNTLLKTTKAKKVITQLNKWKNSRELKNIQLGVSHFIITTYTKYIKMQSMVQAISYKN